MSLEGDEARIIGTLKQSLVCTFIIKLVDVKVAEYGPVGSWLFELSAFA